MIELDFELCNAPLDPSKGKGSYCTTNKKFKVSRLGLSPKHQSKPLFKKWKRTLSCTREKQSWALQVNAIKRCVRYGIFRIGTLVLKINFSLTTNQATLSQKQIFLTFFVLVPLTQLLLKSLIPSNRSNSPKLSDTTPCNISDSREANYHNTIRFGIKTLIIVHVFN